MYEAYWQLHEPPFDNSPNPKFLYFSPAHEEALERLLYAVRQRKGCALMAGEYGCGKTTLSRALIQRLEAERYEVGLVTNPTWTPIEFLRETLYQLGLETTERRKAELLHQLQDLCFRNFEAQRDTVVIVDEAQLIEDPAVFEELRLLLNFQTDDRFLLTLLMIGAPDLVARLRRAKPLDQRVAVRCHLGALDEAHTSNYITHRMKMAGRAERVFSEGAVKLVFDFTHGTPREINNLCDLALLVGYGKRMGEIDEQTIAGVIKDMVGVA